MITYDVYLGGKATADWRNEVKNSIDTSIKIFDPMSDEYDQFDAAQKADQIAMEFEHIENSSVVAFYLDNEWESFFTFLQLGDTVGRDIQVIVCFDGPVESEEKIRRYCEYRGVLIVGSLEELVAVIEECLAETEICRTNV